MDVQNEALDTQADSVDYSNEESVNAAAAKEVEAAKAGVEKSAEQPSKTEVKKPDVADTGKPVQSKTPEKQAPVQPAFDAEKSFADVQKQLAETRKWATQMAQDRAELRKQLDALQKVQKPLADKAVKDSELSDLQQLQRAMQTQDVNALNAFLAKREAAAQSKMKDEYMAAVEEAKAQALAAKNEAKELKYDREVERRKSDSKNYPNFAELEKTMMDMVDSGQVVWDEEKQKIGDVIDHLYNLAKSQHSEEAIKQAEVSGRKKAEAELANEAKAAVAGGGKGVSTTPADLHAMPLDKLEQLAIQLHGVADRD